MPSTATEAHNLLLPFCGDNAGIAISKELVRRLLEDQITRTTARLKSAPGSSPFHGLAIEYEVAIDAAALNLVFEDTPNPNDPSQTFPSLILENIGVSLSITLDTQKVAVLGFHFTRIHGRVIFDNRRLKINVHNEVHDTQTPIWVWEAPPFSNPISDYFETNHNFTDAIWAELQQRLVAIDIFASRDIAVAFLEAIELPDILGMFIGVQFGNDVKVSSIQEFIMLTGTSSFVFSQCPFVSAAGQTTASSSATFQGGAPFPPGSGELPPAVASSPQDVVVSVEVAKTSPGFKYPSENLEMGGIENSERGHVFFFTPIRLLEMNFNGIVKPAINVADSGSFGPFGWSYSLTAALRNFAVKLTDHWPITFVLSTPIQATGQATAFIEIACVKYTFGGAVFEGLVDPLDTEFRIFYDGKRGEIVFESRINRIEGHGFRFKSFPEILWPLTAIVDAILGRVAGRLVTDQAGKVLSVTRIPLARLVGLSAVAPLVANAFPGHADNQGNATFGAYLRL